MHKRIIAIKGTLDTLNFFTDCLVNAFRQLGFEVHIYDYNDGADANAVLADFLRLPVDFVIGYNNAGFLVRHRDKCLWDYLGIYHINIIVDAPVHYTSTIDSYASPRSFFLCVDNDHPYYIDRFWSYIPAAFLPHAAWNYEPVAPDSSRHTDIIYAGSLSVTTLDHIPDVGMGEFNTVDLVNDVYNELINNPNQSAEAVIERWLNSHNLYYDNERLKNIFLNLIHITGAVTSYFRIKQVETLVKSGFKVNVYGDRWNTLASINHPNYIYNGRIAPTQVFEKMADSRIILNSMPWFKAGSHERIFNGMLAGGVVFSDYSAYLDNAFVNGEDLIMYDLSDIEQLPQYVETVLSDREYAYTLALNGQRKVLANHTFVNRAVEIIDYYLNLIQNQTKG